MLFRSQSELDEAGETDNYPSIIAITPPTRHPIQHRSHSVLYWVDLDGEEAEQGGHRALEQSGGEPTEGTRTGGARPKGGKGV